MQIMSYVTSKYTPLIKCWRGFNKGLLITDGLRPPISILITTVFSACEHTLLFGFRRLTVSSPGTAAYYAIGSRVC